MSLNVVEAQWEEPAGAAGTEWDTVEVDTVVCYEAAGDDQPKCRACYYTG